MRTLERYFDRGTLGQFLRYGVSGGSAVLVHFLVLTIMVEWGRLDATFSTAVGFLAGCVVNYLLQYRWVFDARGSHRSLVARYASVTAVTFVLNVLLFHFLLEVLGLWYILAQGIATVVIFLVNFEINRRFTFRHPSG